MADDNKKVETKTPEPATQPVAPTAGTGKSSKKGLIIGIAAGVGVLLLIIIGVVLFFALTAVTKEDYRKGYDATQDTYSKLNASYNDLAQAASVSSTTTETQITNRSDDAKKTLEAYKSATAELADLKALRNADVKKQYDTYKKQSDDYIAYATEFIPSATVAFKAVVACEKIGSTSVSDADEFNKAIVPCEEALDGADEVKNSDFRGFVEAYKKNVSSVKAIVEKSRSIPATDFTQRLQLTRDLRATTTDLNKSLGDTRSNIQKALKDKNPKDSLSELRTQLRDLATK